MSQKLKNKVALITGGNSGMGLSIAKTFVTEGAQVIITGRDKQKLDDAAKRIGNSVLAIPCDISNLKDLTQLYKTIKERIGNIDILVANAGVYVLSPLADFTEDMFDKVNEINFKGTFFTVQKSLSILNEGASIILTSSTVNNKGIPAHSAYAATKAAVRSLARSFSAELIQRGIRVNTLTPGPIDTPVFKTVANSEQEAKEMAKGMGNYTPLKRMGTPNEIANAALYLASDDSSYMVGAELLLDGGLREL